MRATRSLSRPGPLEGRDRSPVGDQSSHDQSADRRRTAGPGGDGHRPGAASRAADSPVQALEPFKPIILARLDRYPALTAVRLFEEIKAAGYTGGISQLRAYVAEVRPRPLPEPLVRFETEPGQQAQVDFAEFFFPWGKRYALLVVLGYSRLLWLRFHPQQ